MLKSQIKMKIKRDQSLEKKNKVYQQKDRKIHKN